MPAKVQFPALRDYEWLRSCFVGHGLSRVAIAELLGCSPTAVSRALAQLGIERPSGWSRPATNGATAPSFDAVDLELAELVAEQRHDPAPAERAFTPTLPDGAHGREVPPDELWRRAREGLEVLAELMGALDRTDEARLFDVVTEMEAGEARLVAFTAAVVAHGQAARVVVG